MSIIKLSLPAGESVCNGKHVSFKAPCDSTGITGIKIGEDGSWTQTTLSSSEGRWTSLTYGNGKFVAVNGFGNISNITAYSTDGINWTQSTLPSSQEWMSVTYGNGKFVAIARCSIGASSSNFTAYSTDGINWTQSTLPSSQEWMSVTYGNGKFVAVGLYSNIAAYSTDGINWTQSTLPSSPFWISVTYGNGKFVTVAKNSTSAAYSTDGINWTQTTLPISKDWMSVTYGNGKFVTVAKNSTSAAYLPVAPQYSLVNTDDDDYVSNGGSWVQNAYITTMLDVDNNKAYVVNEHIGTSPTSLVSVIENPETKSSGQLLGYNGTSWVAVDAPSSSSATYVNYTMARSSWSSTQYSFESAYPSSTYDLEIWGLQSSATDAQKSALVSSDIRGNVSSNIATANGMVPNVDIPVILKVIAK